MDGTDVDFDVVVVGGGVAGAVCAYQLAQQGREVVLLERGTQAGSKNLSGGVFYSQIMEQVFPGFAEQAPVERHITRNIISFLNEDSFVNIDYWDDRLEQPVNAVAVLRAKLDAWLAEQCEAAGVVVLPGTKVDELLFEGDQVVGVRAGEDTLRSHLVVAADGVNSFLAQYAGVRAKEPLAHLAVGVKSVIGLPSTAIEDRFGVSGEEGTAYAVVGEATKGCAGGGFIYTNKESISIGVVLRLDDLVEKGLVASEVHDGFLTHPAVAKLIKDGELLEYGCHLTIEDGPAMASHDLTRPGLMIIGDAAGFTLNTGLAIRGMDLAAGSAIAAASAAGRALDAGDFSQESMDGYVRELKESATGRDMHTYRRAPKALDSPRLYEEFGPLLANILHGLYDLDATPRKHAVKGIASAVKSSGISLVGTARDIWALARAL